jgi:hypothetical protein
MPNAVKYWNGSSWQSPGYFGQVRMWNGSEWRMVEVKYAGGSGSGSWNVPAGLLDYQTVTVGAYEVVDYEFGYYNYEYGYGNYTGGSISDGTSNIYSGAAINGIYYDESGSGAYIILDITGATNSGWTTMNINGTNYSRSSASFSSGQWTWSVAIGSNPFGTSGSKAVYWS